jgi:hypothetical protein
VVVNTLSCVDDITPIIDVVRLAIDVVSRPAIWVVVSDANCVVVNAIDEHSRIRV